MADIAQDTTSVGVYSTVLTLSAAGVFAGVLLSGSSHTKDYIHGGAGFIPVFVGIDDSPDIPLRRKVACARKIDDLTVRTIWTGVDGTGVIEDLNPDILYTVTAYDYTDVYGAVTADDVAPEV